MVIIHCHTEAQQREVFAHPLCMPGSDATTLAPDGPLAGSVFHGAYSWAAWFWRFMVRETRALTPEEAVFKLTGLPARTLNLSGRGVLAEGAAADIAVFAPDEFRRARHDVRAEPARQRHAPCDRQRQLCAARRGADRQTGQAR